MIKKLDSVFSVAHSFDLFIYLVFLFVLFDGIFHGLVSDGLNCTPDSEEYENASGLFKFKSLGYWRYTLYVTANDSGANAAEKNLNFH